MKKSLPPLPSVAKLAKKCGAFAGRAGSPESLASLPVPVPGEGGVRIAVMLAEAELAGEGAPDPAALRIKPPGHVVFAEAWSGAFSELCAIGPADLGLANDPAEPLGDAALAADRDAKRARWLELLDAALPGFAGGPAAITADTRRAAGELRALFPEVAEAPLVPYYRALGRRFFAWLDRTAA